MDKDDIIAALLQQRDGALKAHMEAYAMLLAANREIAALKEKYEGKP